MPSENCTACGKLRAGDSYRKGTAIGCSRGAISTRPPSAGTGHGLAAAGRDQKITPIVTGTKRDALPVPPMSFVKTLTKRASAKMFQRR